MLTPLPFLFIYMLLTILLVRSDILHGLLPDKLVCPLLWLGLLYHLCIKPDDLSDAVTGAMVGYLGFAAIYWGYRLVRKREGMGYGDVKYFAALGAWHGVCILPVLALTAALTAMSYLTIRKLVLRDNYAFKNPLPFGPFLAAAGLCASWQEVINLPL
jgi:Type II secretory pathway, prepilin signal peptidase PulO and related peptidases